MRFKMFYGVNIFAEYNNLSVFIFLNYFFNFKANPITF